MGYFDFFKSASLDKRSNNPSIDLSDFKFLSDDHTRFLNGQPTNANNKGAWRGIKVKSLDINKFKVTIYNMNDNHLVWGDNIQMAEKPMEMINETADKIVLRGCGRDVLGDSFADYGLSLYKFNGQINKVSLHMHDRNVDIVYEKAEENMAKATLLSKTDFAVFKDFVLNWELSMTMQEKLIIARESDAINNKGASAYNDGDIEVAIGYFEKALELMPNNSDSLFNLRLCYSQEGNFQKVNQIKKK